MFLPTLHLLLLLLGYGTSIKLAERAWIDNPASIDSYPFVVFLSGLYGYKTSSTTINCVGSVLTSQWILTAAQCGFDKETKTPIFLQDVKDAKVTVGIHRRDNSSGTVYNISHFIYHKDFDYDSKRNDIALIKVKTPIELISESVESIGLSKCLKDNLKVLTFGRDKLEKLDLTDLRVQSDGRVKARVVVDGSRICQNIVGGPVVNLWTKNQVGINSKCERESGSDGHPHEYLYFTDVGKYEKWIEGAMFKGGQNPPGIYGFPLNIFRQAHTCSNTPRPWTIVKKSII